MSAKTKTPIFKYPPDLERLSEAEIEAVLEQEFPILCNDVGMLIGKPFRLVWDPETETASTDCLAEVRIAPWPFLVGMRRLGFGMAYHEAGHILSSPYGAKLLAESAKEDEAVKHVLNLILDRKDDMLTIQVAPGFETDMRRRLPVICTLSRHAEAEKATRGWKVALDTPRKRGAKAAAKEREMDGDERLRFLSRLRPQDAFEDFFFACKWHRRPRTKAARKAMKYLTRTKLLAMSPARLLWTAQRIAQILGQTEDGKRQVSRSVRSDGFLLVGSRVSKVLRRVAKRHVERHRKNGLEQLEQRLKAAARTNPGPFGVSDKKNEVPIKQLKPRPQDAGEYRRLVSSVDGWSEQLKRVLRKINSPSEYTLYGQDEGEIDFSEAARIAAGLGGFRQETVIERDVDAEIHLAIDCSGSMFGDKVLRAKQLAALFSEGLGSLGGMCDGHLWAYNSEGIYDLGDVAAPQAVCQLEGGGGNSDTHMLVHVGKTLCKSKRKRRILIVLCDDGPDDAREANRLSQLLLARGVLVIHLLVGVHGTPQIFPIELIYTSMDECLDDFGKLLEVVIKNLR
jgi:hypothetical protein